jgi:2-keto-3-deoxy-L-rhamnonate aldolase RhmA
MRHNRLRALLNAGEPSIGTYLLSSWPTLVELIGDAGIALMIEKRECVEDLDAVKGIDMVQFGSSDYSMNGEGMRGMLTGPPSAAAPKQTVSTY